MRKEWKINSHSFEHTVVYEANKEMKQYEIFVDGSPIEILKTSFVPLMGMEHVFEFYGQKYRIVHRGENADLVVNGVLQERQRRYYPSKMILTVFVLSILLLICGMILLSMHFNEGKDTFTVGLVITIVSMVLSGGVRFLLQN